jgi:hypothetical protein
MTTADILAKLQAGDISLSQASTMIEALTPKAAPSNLHFKVSEKGAVSVYGLQARFPVTLYSQQWERLLAKSDELKKFMADNAGKLSTK